MLKDIANKPLTAALLHRYKSIAHGEWQTESVSLADQAWSISNFVEQGAGPDYGQTVLAAIDATTAPDVLRVAQAYLAEIYRRVDRAARQIATQLITHARRRGGGEHAPRVALVH